MFFDPAAIAATASKDATDSFINVATNNGSFDIFQSARDTLSSSLYKAGIVGAVSRQAYRIYKGVSNLSSSSSESEIGNSKQNSSQLAKQWSEGSTKRLENFVRLGAAGYSCHLGSNVRDYIKTVFDPNPNQKPQQQQQQQQLTREQKMAKLTQAAKTRLAGVVVTPVIQSYLFTIEIILASIVHPIALYEIHNLRSQEGLMSPFSNNNNNNNDMMMMNNMMMPSAAEGLPLQQNNGGGESGWMTKILSAAMKLSVGTPPPQELLQPPPTLELRGSLAAPSAEASNNDNNINDDDDDDRQQQQESSRRSSKLNEMLITLIRGMKQETEAFLEKNLGEDFGSPLNRVSTKKIEEVVQKAIANPALYLLAPPGLEWMIEVVLVSSNNSPLFRSHNNNNSGSLFSSVVPPPGEPLQEIDQRIVGIYYKLMNQIVSTDSFNRLMLKASETIAKDSILPALDDTWPTCKSFLASSEALSSSSSSNNDNNNNDNTATPRTTTQQATVQVAHLGGALTSVVYTTAEAELTKILFPELFVAHDDSNSSPPASSDEEEEKDPLDSHHQQEEEKKKKENNQNQDEEEDPAKREERIMRERQLKAMRKFPSFGDLSTYGGLCMQFARFAIESNVGGEFFIHHE